MGKKSRDKGARGERELANYLRDVWGYTHCRRSQQYDGKYVADLVGGPDELWIECKRYRRIPALDWLERCAEESHNDERYPAVITRDDGRDWAVIMRLDDLLEVLRDGAFEADRNQAATAPRQGARGSDSECGGACPLLGAEGPRPLRYPAAFWRLSTPERRAE